MSVISSDQIDTVEDLIEAMAKAINPAAFTYKAVEKDKILCRLAAQRALAVAAPVILREAAALAGDRKEIASDILRLNELF